MTECPYYIEISPLICFKEYFEDVDILCKTMKLCKALYNMVKRTLSLKYILDS